VLYETEHCISHGRQDVCCDYLLACFAWVNIAWLAVAVYAVGFGWLGWLLLYMRGFGSLGLGFVYALLFA